jgi:hypothetical protein
MGGGGPHNQFCSGRQKTVELAVDITMGSDVMEIRSPNSPWPESASELCRPRDRSLLANLVPTLAYRGCCVVSATDPHGRILGFLDRSRYFSFK